jgi:phage-related protein
MKGFGGAHTLEIVEDDDGNTYRAVYTLRFEGVIYVLHAFQKKSRQGTKTDRADLRLIEERMKVAQDHHKENYAPKQFGRGTGNG